MAEDSPSTSRQSIVNEALDKIGEALRARGLTLEELIESGRKEREKILRDQSNQKICRPSHE